MPSAALGALLAAFLLTGAPGCTPSAIIGPLSHEQDERDHLVMRARVQGTSGELIDKVVPPLTPYEEDLAREQDSSCRSSYMWKNGLTWTGSLLIASAAGITVGGAYATGNNDSTGKLAFGLSAGTLATLGSGLVAIGGIIANGFSDRGCQSRMAPK
jgi:hypothetical protein